MTQEEWGPCDVACNYGAEIQAIRKALEAIRLRHKEDDLPPSQIVILTDAMSVLQVMENRSNWPQDIENLILASDELCQRFGDRVLYQWVPGHMNLAGNERADCLAKRGGLDTPTFTEPGTTPCSYDKARTTIRRWETTRWNESWDNSLKGREVWRNLPRPNRADAWWRLNRSEQCIISQFRTGHCPIGAYFGRIRPNFDSRCRHCGLEEETVEHILRECPQLADSRKDELGNPLSLDLYGDLQALRQTASYISGAQRD